MNRFLAHSAAVVLAVSTAAEADIMLDIPKSHRGVRTEVVFEGLESFPDTAFVLYPAQPTADGRGWSLVKTGESARFYGLLGPKLYAVKRGVNPAFDAAFFPKPGTPPPKNPLVLDETLTAQLLATPHSEKAFVAGYVKLADSNPTKSIQSVYRVTGITRNRITFDHSERRLDAAGTVIKASSRSWFKAPFEGKSSSATGTDETQHPSWQRTPIALATGTLAALSVLGLIRAKRQQSRSNEAGSE
jgi:hypothetical protein